MDWRRGHLVAPGSDVDLDAIPCLPHDAEWVQAKAETKVLRRSIRDLQRRLYAEHQRAFLAVLQGLDTAGKDGATKRVFGDCDTQGVWVTGFKAPTSTEAARDHLWRIHRSVPAKGHIGVFNRSHYGSVVVERVLGIVDEDELQRRYRHILDFERLLTETGTKVRKFFLHISDEEQRRRLQTRIDDPAKRWKLSPSDLETRARRHEHRAAYEDAIAATSTEECPWIIVPADDKRIRDRIIAGHVEAALTDMDPSFPAPTDLPDRID